jgi:peptidyl-prolyl cis-trans isomerase D
MLKFFSRMERTRNFVLLLFAIVMVVSLIVFYAPTRDTIESTLVQSEETVAEVGGEEVTVGELVRQKEAFARFTGDSQPAKTLLDQTIRSRIARIEAAQLGLRATDMEVASKIREEFKTEDGKPFDQKRYEQNAIQNAGSVSALEEEVRDSLSAQKLQTFITSGVSVSEEEVLEDYKRSNTKFEVSYVPISVADLAQTFKPTDEELKKYFEENKKNYYISTPQKKIRYLFLNTAKIGERLNVPEADLKAEYDKLPADKRIAGVQGQEIVLRIPKPEFDAEIAAKANEIVERLKKDGGAVSEEAFAEVARGQSENPNTARTGGKIPGLIKQNPTNPEDPYQRLLTMQPGDVTAPISYQGRYFILRRGEDVPKSFENAKKELEVSLRNRRAYAVAAEIAQKAAARLKEVKDVQTVAQEFAQQANMSASEMVKETGYIKPGDKVEDIGTSPQFEQGIAALENPNDIGDRTPVPNGFAIPVLVDKREPRDAEFEDVKAQVAETYKIEQARNKVEEIAKQIASGAGSASGLTSAAESRGLKSQEQKNYILGSPLGQGPTATTSEQLEDAIWGLKEGEVTKTPIKLGDNWYVVGLNKREEANMDDFAQQRDGLFKQKLSEKRNRVFTDYLAATRAEMEAAGKIKIYKEALKKVDGEDATGDETQPGFPQGIPQQIPQGN